MEIHNRFVVAKGQRVSHGRENYKAGRKFPAAHLKIPEESVAALIRDGAIYDPAETPAPPVIDDGLDVCSKSELLDLAERYGLEVKSRMSKDEIIVAIRERDADEVPPTEEPPADAELDLK
jgi:hypothetical protein